MIERLTVIGVGLIGGSLAMALRQAGYVKEVVGVGRSRENLELAVARRIIDRFSHDPAEGAQGADMVFLAAPVEQIPALALAVRDAVAPRAVVTDGGSTKQRICEAVEPLFAAGGDDSPAFVGGHPIAGTEKSGAGAAFPELYHRKRTILTPGSSTPAWAVERVRAMWEAAGANVETMTPERHDAVLAAISHLPHAAAFALVNAVLKQEEAAGEPILPYAAGGFLDFTRIASSDPAMWRDIFLQNGGLLLQAIAGYERELQALRAMIEARDAEALVKYFAGAKAARDNLVRR